MKVVLVLLLVALLTDNHVLAGNYVESDIESSYGWANPVSRYGQGVNRTALYQLPPRDVSTVLAFGPQQIHRQSMNTVQDVAGVSLGVPQDLGAVKYRRTRNAVLKQITKGQKYMKSTVMKDDKFKPVRDICQNLRKECAAWAQRGDCKKKKTKTFMARNCAPVCQSCEEVHTDTRCPLDRNERNALYPGDLNKMFERIVDSGEFDSYDLTVHSRPSLAKGDKNETAGYMIGPWVITIDNFLSEEEATTLIRLGSDKGYKRSRDVGKTRDDGSFSGRGVKSKGRTSTNSWCNKECRDHAVTKKVTERISSMISIPDVNSENYQMLKYEPGQFYNVHHDYILREAARAQGPRILTVFLYLNDVEEGGATNFNQLDLAVVPKRGRVLIWPSVLDEDPHRKDGRTSHEAQEVIKGVKYGANAWYHMRNYKIPKSKGCV